MSLQLSEDSTQLREQMFAAAQFAQGRGVSGLGTSAAWLNGLLINAEEGLMWQQLIQYNLQVEQQRLQVRAALLTIWFSKQTKSYSGKIAHAQLSLHRTICQLRGTDKDTVLLDTGDSAAHMDKNVPEHCCPR